MISVFFILFGCYSVWALKDPHAMILEKNHLKHHSSSSSSSSRQSNCQHNLIPDVGLYPFRFGRGNAGLFSPDTFFFLATGDGVQLLVTDCFCPGDKFVIFDNGTPIGGAANAGVTDGTCQVYEDQPLNCLASWEYSHLVMQLPAGPHNITIMAAFSPFNGGTGFIGLEAVDSFDGPLCGMNCNYSIYNDGGCLP